MFCLEIDQKHSKSYYASTRLPSKKIHAPIWSMVALEGNYSFDQNARSIWVTVCTLTYKVLSAY